MWSKLWDDLGEDWLCSRRAAKTFLLATVLIFPTSLQMLGKVTPESLPLWAQYPWLFICVVGTAALFFLWFGMWRYWAKLDHSNRATKRLWFVVLLFGLWIGACFYFYGAYLPQVIRQWREVS